MDAANQLGVNIPEDLSIIRFDNRERSYFYLPKLTTMDLPPGEMEEKSAKILLDMINNEGPEERNLKLNCRLIERGSVANINLK